jgi:hypothetical protein
MASKNSTPNKFAKNYHSRTTSLFFSGCSTVDEMPYSERIRFDFEKAKLRHQKCVERAKTINGNELVLNECVKLLLEFSISAGEWYSVDRSAFLGENLDKTREIGVAIYQIGGIKAMISICQMIPEIDRRELDYAWDGVGIWKS